MAARLRGAKEQTWLIVGTRPDGERFVFRSRSTEQRAQRVAGWLRERLTYPVCVTVEKLQSWKRKEMA